MLTTFLLTAAASAQVCITAETGWPTRVGRGDGSPASNRILAVDEGGFVILAGQTVNPSAPEFGVWRFDEDGTQVGFATVSGGCLPSGGTDLCHGMLAEVDPLLGAGAYGRTVYVAGTAKTTAGLDVIVAAFTITSTGGLSQQWCVNLNNSAQNGHDVPVAMVLVPELAAEEGPRLWLAIDSAGAGTGTDIWTVALNATPDSTGGGLEFSYRHDGAGHQTDVAADIGYAPAGTIQGVGETPAVVCVCGTVFTSQGAGNDIVTMCFSAASPGTAPLWTKVFHESTADDQAAALALSQADHAVFVTGSSKRTGTGYDYVTFGYDYMQTPPSGTLNGWPVYFNRPGQTGNDYAVKVKMSNPALAEQPLYVTGASTDSTSGVDYVTQQYGIGGATGWNNVYRFSTTSALEDRPVDMIVGAPYGEAEQEVYVTGYSSNGTTLDFATIRINAAGTHEGTARYDYVSTDRTAAVRFWPIGTDDEYPGLVVTGRSISLVGAFLEYTTFRYQQFLGQPGQCPP